MRNTNVCPQVTSKMHKENGPRVAFDRRRLDGHPLTTTFRAAPPSPLDSALTARMLAPGPEMIVAVFTSWLFNLIAFNN